MIVSAHVLPVRFGWILLLVLLGPAAMFGAEPGEVRTSRQFGAERQDFQLDGRGAFVILPTRPAADGTKPWIWYAPTFIGRLPGGIHDWLFTRLLDRGFAVAGIDVDESYGNPAGRREYTKLYEHVVEHFGLSAKACLLPQSRGGLMLYNWAVEHPDHVQCIGGIYTVCDLASYPGLARACGAYGLSETELAEKLTEHNPVDRLAPLARAKVPILLVHGDADKVVPLEKNSAELVRRYRALGGPAEVIVIPGRGHQVCPEFFECERLLEFFLRQGGTLELSHSRAARPPNFLVIVADDMGFADAGCYGGEIATPNLDRLAAGGLRFTQCYSTGRCWPSRACILTGYYAQQVRMDPPKGKLPAWTRVVPHYLAPLGYRCYHSGKWHLRGAPRAVADGGFDRSYLVADQDRFFSPKRTSLDDRALPPVERGTGYYTTTVIADHAVEFLTRHAKEHADRPFLLYLAFTSPHFPLQALQEDIDRYRDRFRVGWDVVRRERLGRMHELGIVRCELSELDGETVPAWNFSAEKLAAQIGPGEAARAVPWADLTDAQRAFQATKMAIHAAMIDRMDREIGRVLDQLRAMGAEENTLVVFVSDNGASAEQIIRGDGHDPAAPPGSADSYLCLGPGWSTAANTPLRLHKSWVHEGGISSPLIVHWPAGIAARGELRHTPCHFIDLVPTLVELAGGEVSPEWNGRRAPPLPGRSLVPAFRADAEIDRPFFYFHHIGNRAIRVDDWKLVAAGSGGPWELYNLRTDRRESHNLAAEHPARVKELAELWQQKEDEFRHTASEGE